MGARPGAVLWWTTVLGGGAATSLVLFGSFGDVRWVSPLGLFWIVTIAASLCAVGSIALLVSAFRRQMAEAAILAAGLWMVSVLPLVHGLTAPGVLYGPNPAVVTSVFIALPLAEVVMAPLVVGGSAFGRWSGQRWKAWSLGWVGVGLVLAIGLLAAPNAAEVTGPSHPLTWLVSGGALVGALALSRIQLRLYWIGERPATLMASIACVLLGLTSLVWLGGEAFGVGWWLVHALDIVGVFLVHDVGKLETPDAILNKVGGLDESEYALMQEHTIDGGLMLRSVPSLAPVARLVRAHHERIDGEGYPDRLRGEVIPLESRIVAVCDGFDAMANTRQYRSGMGQDRAVAILQEHAGSQWDEAVVAALVRALPHIDQSQPLLDRVGRYDLACGCSDALPDDVRQLLAG